MLYKAQEQHHENNVPMYLSWYQWCLKNGGLSCGEDTPTLDLQEASEDLIAHGMKDWCSVRILQLGILEAMSRQPPLRNTKCIQCVRVEKMLPAAVTLPPNSVLSCTGFCVSVCVCAMLKVHVCCRSCSLLLTSIAWVNAVALRWIVPRKLINSKFVLHTLFRNLALDAQMVYYTKPKRDFLLANKHLNCAQYFSVLLII